MFFVVGLPDLLSIRMMLFFGIRTLRLSWSKLPTLRASARHTTRASPLSTSS